MKRAPRSRERGGAGGRQSEGARPSPLRARAQPRGGLRCRGRRLVRGPIRGTLSRKIPLRSVIADHPSPNKGFDVIKNYVIVNYPQLFIAS